jgi:hypothetical protein
LAFSKTQGTVSLTRYKYFGGNAPIAAASSQLSILVISHFSFFSFLSPPNQAKPRQVEKGQNGNDLT